MAERLTKCELEERLAAGTLVAEYWSRSYLDLMETGDNWWRTYGAIGTHPLGCTRAALAGDSFDPVELGVAPESAQGRALAQLESRRKEREGQ